jgi:hypothetical protein
MRAHAFARKPQARHAVAPVAQQVAPGQKARDQAADIRHILGRVAVQPKLKIGNTNDALEQEADRVADRVMRMEFPDPVSNSGPSAPDVQRRCAECDGQVQRQADDDEDFLQTQSDGPAPTTATIDRGIATGICNGRPLSASARSFFQARFGRSFDDVRIHTGSASDRAAKTIDARAFTLGSDIAFAEGEYRPESSEGKRLLAHELTHVLQQPRPPLEPHTAATDEGEGRLNVTAGPSEIRRQGPKNPIKEAFGRWVTANDVVPQHFNWPDDICSQAGIEIFEWAVDFETSLETGYIVQRIDNVFDAENCDGTSFTGFTPTPRYWERWYVENHKMQTNKSSNYNADDAWVRNLCNPVTPSIVGCDPYPHATRGNWSMTGALYILADTSNPGSFYRPNRDVPDAGNLEATLTDPGPALGRPKGSRTASGSWDCCRAAPAQSNPNQLNRIGP